MPKPLDILEASLNERFRVTLKDGRHLVGILRGFDPYLNLVMDEVQETEGELKTALGSLVLRGANVVAMAKE